METRSSKVNSLNKDKNDAQQTAPPYQSFFVFRNRFDIWREYKIEAPIGQGGFGVVCRAENVKTKKKVAIKKITN
jgi:serine/threonine protein kinase